MAKTISTKFRADGEKEYREALRGITSGLNVLSTEMKLVTERYADNASGAEALQAKNDLLQRTYATQKEKVETLRQALADAAQTYGESSTRTMKWQAELNKEEAQLLKVGRQLKENAKAYDDMAGSEEDAEEETEHFTGLLESAAGQTQGLGDTIGSLASKLGVNLPPSLTKAANGLGSVSAGAAAAVGAFAALAAIVVKVEQALIDMTKQSAKAADELLTLSKTSNLAVDTLQELNYAAEFLDVSTTTITGSLTKLTNKMQDAQTGSGAAADAFNRLGVTVTNADGSLRSAESVFRDCIDALGGVANETERDALAMDVFGKSAQELNPLIKAGSAELDALAQEARDVGYVLDNQTIEALGKTQDAFDRLDKATEAAHNRIAGEFAPGMTSALDSTTQTVQNLSQALEASGLVDSFGTMLGSAASLLETLSTLAGPLLKQLNEWLQPIAMTMALIADTANVIAGIFTLDWDRIKTGLSWNAANGKLSNQQKADPKWKEFLKNNHYDATYGGYVPNTTDTSSTYTGVTLSEEARVAAEEEYWRQKNYVVDTGDWTKQYYIPHNAGGTGSWSGGWSWVGEAGPELTWMPPQTRVFSAQESEQLSGGDVYNITVEARSIKEFEDIVRLAKNQRRLRRMGAS